MHQLWSEAIRGARTQAALSIDDLAGRARIPPARLVALEGEAADVSVGELMAISHALRLDLPALLRGEVVREPSASLAFRSRAEGWAALTDADLAACEAALRAARSLLRVNERLGRPAPSRWSLAPTTPSVALEKEVIQLAGAVRALLGNAEGCLPDMVGVFDSLDLLVVEHDFRDDRVEAVAVMESAAQAAAAVLVSPRSSSWRHPRRRRVLLAHELCHALFDRGENGAEVVTDLAPLSPADEGTDDARYLPQDVARERRARAFAAELLIPTAALTSLLGPPRGSHDYAEAKRLVSTVRERFETPIELALNQLWNRRYLVAIPGLASEDPRSELLSWLRWHGGTSEEEPVRTPTAPGLLARRVEEAWRGDLCSDGEARRWLGLSPTDDLPFGRTE